MYLSTQAYLYKWTQISTGKWYVGCRTAKTAHPSDGYICSSKIVKPLIIENPDDWVREILVIGDPNYIKNLESEYLLLLNAKDDNTSYNLHNGDGKFTTIGVSPWNKGLSLEDPRIAKAANKTRGKPSPLKGREIGPYAESRRNNISNALKGKTPWNAGVSTGPLSEEHRNKLSKCFKDKAKSESHKEKMRKPKSDEMRKKLSSSKTGNSWKKVVCRLFDRREMDIGNYTKWTKRQPQVHDTQD